MPKVSVIVPNYNHAPYLKQRLDSIFNQTFQDLEVIILDDCSTDNSKEIIEQYQSNPKVSHIVYNETNSGSPFKQWAKGFDLAQGEFIWIAESDDWADINFLNEVLSNLQANSQIVLCFCESIWSYTNEQVKKTLFADSQTFNGFDFLRHFMVEKNSICNASSVVFRKSALANVSAEYQTFKGSGDWQFWLELCMQGMIHYLAKPLNYFRQHQTNTTNNQKINGNAYKEMIKIFNFLKKQKAISPYMRISIPVVFLDYLKKNDILRRNSPRAYNYLITEWKQEIFFYPIAKFIERSGFYLWKLFASMKHLL